MAVPVHAAVRDMRELVVHGRAWAAWLGSNPCVHPCMARAHLGRLARLRSLLCGRCLYGPFWDWCNVHMFHEQRKLFSLPCTFFGCHF